MNVAKVIEISSESDVSFEAAIHQGITKAAETVHNIKGAWVKEQKVSVENDRVTTYRVVLKISFVMD